MHQTIICTESPCTIECSSNYACYNSTIICDTDQCDILCQGEWSCEYNTINCLDATTCNIECIGSESCEYAQITKPTTVTCGTGNYACRYSTINCSSTDYCNIYCTGWHTCSYSTINAVQNLSCSGSYSCYGSDINCIASDLCDIYCAYESCRYSHIQCLESDNCIVNCTTWHACSNSLLNGLTHIECGGKLTCFNSTMNCDANECNIICDGHTGCQFNSIDCSQSNICNIQCDNWNSCSFSTMIGVTDLTCSGIQEWGCHGSNIICNNNNNCNIYCNREGCSSAMIASPNDYNLSITCTNYKSCNQMNVAAELASELRINKCIDQLSCINMTIFCPSNYNGNKRCFMEGNQYFTHIQLYAIYGWNDVYINDLAINYGGSMHCGIDYLIQCNISTTEWLCDNVLHICNNPPIFNPTKQPTNNPISAPTDNPSLTPTNNPTYTPTNLPLPIPTFPPTITPTKLICAERLDEITASFMISFDYIETENNLSNKNIENIINNITNIFIEETIATNSNCEFDAYDSVSNINGNNVIINILACFECNEITITVNDYNNTKLQKDFIETFKRESNVLIVEINSTIIKVTIKEPEKEVIDTTNIDTTYDNNILKPKMEYGNDIFITVMIICTIIIAFCIVCFISYCIRVYIKQKHMQTNEINEKKGQSIAMINMKPIGRINSNSNIQIGENIEKQMGNNNEQVTIPYVTKGEENDMLSGDDIIIGDDEETPNDSNNDTDSIIIGDDEQTKTTNV